MNSFLAFSFPLFRARCNPLGSRQTLPEPGRKPFYFQKHFLDLRFGHRFIPEVGLASSSA